MKSREETKPPIAFISHNKADQDIAREIAIFLASEGVNVWFDEWMISAGDSIVQEINVGLHGCTHFFILWSEKASKSHWVRRELQSTLAHAIDTGTPRVIPILLDTTPLPPLLSDLLYIRYQGETEKNRRNIVKAATGQLPSNTLIQAIVKKYHEVIYNSEFLSACPSCGSTRLKTYNASIYYEDEPPIGVICKDCGWRGTIPPSWAFVNFEDE